MSKNIEINIPTSLSEITLRQYKEFSKLCDKKDLTQSQLTQAVLTCFCGLSVADSFKVKAVDAQAINDVVLDMFQQKPQRITFFTLNGVEYGIIPNFDDITFGEQIDLDENISGYDKLHLAMAVMYRPVKTRDKNGLYNIEDYEPLKYDMQDIPMSAVMYAQVFFYNLGIDLLKHTVGYTLNLEELQDKTGLHKDGVGFPQYMLSLEEILQDLNISLN